MEEKNRWPLRVADVKTARNRNRMAQGYQEIEAIGRAGGEIPSRIEDKH
jgi:hypothetical protein